MEREITIINLLRWNIRDDIELYNKSNIEEYRMNILWDIYDRQQRIKQIKEEINLDDYSYEDDWNIDD